MATFDVCLSSGDMTTMHLSPYEVIGVPNDSGRAELLALLVLVKYASELFSGMADVHLDLHSNSLEAVNFAKDPYVWRTPSLANKRNINLKLRLREVMSMTSVNFSFLHVKAHHDDELSYEDLTFPAKLNFHCDATARRHL